MRIYATSVPRYFKSARELEGNQIMICTFNMRMTLETNCRELLHFILFSFLQTELYLSVIWYYPEISIYMSRLCDMIYKLRYTPCLIYNATL